MKDLLNFFDKPTDPLRYSSVKISLAIYAFAAVINLGAAKITNQLCLFDF